MSLDVFCAEKVPVDIQKMNSIQKITGKKCLNLGFEIILFWSTCEDIKQSVQFFEGVILYLDPPAFLVGPVDEADLGP